MTTVTPVPSHLDDGPDSPDAVAERREDILQAAAEVFFEVGYGAAGFPVIAERAGLEVAQIAEQFDSKASLLVEAAGREAQDFMGTVVRSLTRGSPSAAVLTTLIVELQSGPTLPIHQLLAETLATGIRDGEVRHQLEPHLRYATAALTVVIRQAKTDRLLAAEVDVDAITHACLTLMLGSCLAKSLKLDQPRPDQAQAFMLKFVDGLTSRDGDAIDLRDVVEGARAPGPAPAGAGAPVSPGVDPPPPRGR